MKNIWSFKKENIKNYIFLAALIITDSLIDSNVPSGDKKNKFQIFMWGLVLLFGIYQSLKVVNSIRNDD